MPLLDTQRRLREIGRLRIGEKTDKGHPTKLDRFRFTSADRTVIEAAATLYGGTVREWVGAPVGEQWEVVTNAARLPVIVPPGPSVISQWWELWSGGGCQRRCDSVTEVITDQPCLCAAEDKKVCKATTRLNLILADLPGLGTWRLESHGYYAATELAGTVEVCQQAAGRGQLLPAVLGLEARQVKRTVNGKPQTMNFVVPTLDINLTPTALGVTTGQGWTPVGELETETPALLPAKPRANAAEPIKATGLTPRPAAIQEVEVNEGRIAEQAEQVEQAELVPTGAVAELKALLGTLHARDKAKLMSTWGSAVGGTVGVESDIGETDARKVLDAWGTR